MRVVPRGAGSGQIYTLNSTEQLFHQSRSPFLSVLFHQSRRRVSPWGKSSAIRGWHLQGFWHQPLNQDSSPSISRSWFHSFDFATCIQLGVKGRNMGFSFIGCRSKQNLHLSQAFKSDVKHFGRCHSPPKMIIWANPQYPVCKTFGIFD